MARVGVGEPRGRLGEVYAKHVAICPTQACTGTAAERNARDDRTSVLYGKLSISLLDKNDTIN